MRMIDDLRKQLRRCAISALMVTSAFVGCAAPETKPTIEAVTKSQPRFRDFIGPRKLGTVENIGVQLPTCSPDGRRLLYLRTDQPFVSPMSVLGSTNPADTPAGGTLSLWLRPLAGSGSGRRLSPRRWVHSPVWSQSGQAVVFVSNENGGSVIVHANPYTSDEAVLGVPGNVNCMPRFDGDDRTVLFCTGPSAHDPFRVCRQSIDDGAPVMLSPEGVDCLLPIRSAPGAAVLCARPEAGHLNWVKANTAGVTDLVPRCGLAERPMLLQAWAAIPEPLSPDGLRILIFDAAAHRVCTWHPGNRTIRRHWRGTIGGCWVSEDVFAAATEDRLMIVGTNGRILTTLSGGPWVPLRYVDRTRRLILAGRDRARSLALQEIVFAEARQPFHAKTGAHGPRNRAALCTSE